MFLRRGRDGWCERACGRGEEVGGCWVAPGVGGYDSEDLLVVDGEESVSLDLGGFGMGGFLWEEGVVFCG